MNAAAALIGLVLIVLIAWDVFQAIVLTRRATRRLQLTRAFLRAYKPFWKAVVERIQDRTRRENLLSLLGPVFLFARFGVWGVGLVFAFALLQWAAGSEIASPPGAASFGTILYFSGTTLFTVALGDVTPPGIIPRLLNVVEAASGFGFLGLILSYLPVFYGDYSRREVHLATLDEWASSPPSAGELLRRLAQDREIEALIPFLREWEQWSAELLESHLSYPILCYFRSQHENQSWVSALATILDVSALVIVGIKNIPPRTARLTYAIARHTAVDLAQAVGEPLRETTADRLPPNDSARLRSLLASEGLELAEGPAADAKLRRLRAEYEPYLNSLSDALYTPLPSWLPESKPTDNWQRTARGADHDY